MMLLESGTPPAQGTAYPADDVLVATIRGPLGWTHAGTPGRLSRGWAFRPSGWGIPQPDGRNAHPLLKRPGVAACVHPSGPLMVATRTSSAGYVVPCAGGVPLSSNIISTEKDVAFHLDQSRASSSHLRRRAAPAGRKVPNGA